MGRGRAEDPRERRHRHARPRGRNACAGTKEATLDRHRARADGSKEIWTAKNVVSSAALADLSRALKPSPISLLHARALRYRDFLIVALIAKNGERMPDNWIYIHDPSVKVGRVQNFASWSPEMVPDPRIVSLGMEYFCFEGDGLWAMPDADLIEMAKGEIGRSG